MAEDPKTSQCSTVGEKVTAHPAPGEAAAAPAAHSAATSGSTTTTKERLAWPDVAKGLSIVGVVLLHVCLAVPGGMDTRWADLNHFLDPLRMPLFFLVSGMFSTKVLSMSLWNLFSRRLWFFWVPFMVWMPIEKYLKHVQWKHTYDMPMPTWKEGYQWSYYTGESLYWFLHALIVFNLVLWATRKLPGWAAIAVSFAPLLVLPYNQETDFVGKALMYLPIFVAGCRLMPGVRRFSRSIGSWEGATHRIAGLRLLTWVALAYVAGSVIYLLWSPIDLGEMQPVQWPFFGDFISGEEQWILFRTVGQLLMLPAGVLLAILLSKVPYVSGGLQFLGRNTLPIYLGHPLALTLLFHFPFEVSDALRPGRPFESLAEAPDGWIVLCLLISALGSYVMWLLMRTPVVGLSLKPPAIAHLPAQIRVHIVERWPGLFAAKPEI